MFIASYRIIAPYRRPHLLDLVDLPQIQMYRSSFFLSLLWACRACKESHSLLLSVPTERYKKR